MRTKAEIRKLIRGGLTGEKAGKLVLEDNWLVDRGQEGFLTDKDMGYIKSSLKTSRDIEVYNSYIRLYELVDYTLKDAKIFALEAQLYLVKIDKKLERLLQKTAHNWNLLTMRPAIVTQKEYEDLSERQRQLIKMKKPIALDELLAFRAEHYPEDKGDRPLAWKTAIHEIQELIREGKLTPLKLKDKQDYHDFMKREIDYRDAEDTVKWLNKLLEEGSSLPEEEMDILLERTVFIGSELYKTGLPEWIEWMDNYTPNLDEMTAARPEDLMQSGRVAIIQNPKPEEVDRRGYWKKKDVFSSKENPEIEEYREAVDIFLDAAKERIKSFLAILAVMDAISQIVGIDFSEDMRQWYEQIESTVENFNNDVDSLFTPPQSWLEDLGDFSKSCQMKIGSMKPTAKSLKYYQERMAIALGSDWMGEAVESLEYDPAAEGSLTQAVADELGKKAQGTKDG
jgi:hypothetical protein